MSSLRLLCVSRVAATSRRTLSNGSPHSRRMYARWQSTKPSAPSRFRAGRVAAYTITASGLMVGGVLTYANHDPVFKNQVEEYVPGFAQVADRAADMYVGLVDSVRSRGGTSGDKRGDKVGVGLDKSNIGLGTVFGGRKREGREDESPLPRTADETQQKTSSTSEKRVALPTPQETAVNADSLAVPQAKSSEPEQKQAVSEPAQTSTQKEDVLAGQTDKDQQRSEKEPAVSVENAAAVKEKGKTEEKVKKKIEEAREKVEAVKEEIVEKVERVKEEVGEVKEKLGGKVGEVREKVESVGERVQEKVEGMVEEGKGKMERAVEGVKGGVERAVEEVRGEVERVAGEVREEKVREQQEAQMADQQLGWLKDSAQVEEKLEETFQKFLSQTDKVLEAQRGVVTASQEQSRLVTSSSEAVEDLQSAQEAAGVVYRVEENVQVSHEALKDALKGYKTVSQSLRELMGRAVELGLKSKVEEVEVKVGECVERLAEGSVAMQEAKAEKDLLQDYQRQAQRDREQLQKELGQELPEGDSVQEAVLMMLGRRVEVLKQRLQHMEKEHRDRLTAALEKQKAGLEELAERRLEWSLRGKEREMQQELSYQVDKMHREFQSDLREQLKRQTDTHNQHLTDALNTQAEQLVRKWSGELELKLTEQEGHYQRELARAVARLRAIEHMVNTIAAAGNETKRQQSLRAACDSLHAVLQSASVSPDPDERCSLKREVSTLRDAGKDDPFILAVLDSLPAHAVSSDGIQGEAGLRERFVKVKRICRRVALVPATGGGMGTYALSYLQSLLVVSWRFVGRVRGREGESDKDPQKLDTFEILERADACLRQGDMEQAVRYINLLQGEPRRVARDWLYDARDYLETCQAILLVSEYMAALNITGSAATVAAAQNN